MASHDIFASLSRALSLALSLQRLLGRIEKDQILTMVRRRGSMMAGMRPSSRIPMRASNDGLVWHTNTQMVNFGKKALPDDTIANVSDCIIRQQYTSSILRSEAEDRVSETWTHPDTCEFSPSPHKQRRQSRHDQDTGEASLYHSGMIPDNEPIDTIINIT